MNDPVSETRRILEHCSNTSGRSVRICDSCELVMSSDDASELDAEFLKLKVDSLCSFSVVRTARVVDCAVSLTNEDISHKQFTSHNEMPLLLHLDPSSECENLPVKVYESMYQAASGASIFVNVDFVIDTSDSERVAVDYIMQSAASARDKLSSPLTAHVRTLKNAVSMLVERMRMMKIYLENVKSGSVPRNEAMLRSAASLLNQLPLLPFDEIKDEYYTHRDDARLVMFLARLTSGLHGADEIVKGFLSSDGIDEPSSASSWSARKASRGSTRERARGVRRANASADSKVPHAEGLRPHR